jgi:hypothetical protein
MSDYLKKKHVHIGFILFPMIMLRGAADGWVQDVRLSLDNDVVP